MVWRAALPADVSMLVGVYVHPRLRSLVFTTQASHSTLVSAPSADDPLGSTCSYLEFLKPPPLNVPDFL